MVERIRVNLPVSRIVQGDLYKANDTDFVTKQKRVYPAGHRLAGQPKISYFFALAIRKNPGEQHWAQTPWGKQIWDFGCAAWPPDQRGVSAVQRPDFAWKVEDGDSTVPNKNNRINARTEGFAGCWIVSCSSTYPPKIITTDFTPITEPNAVKRGFHVEVVVTVDSNESQGNPGIYVNGEFVMFRAIDKEISGAVDPRSIQGFGQSALPAGLTPVGGPPAPGGAPMAPYSGPAPSFPTPGTLPPAPGLAGVPGAPQPPAFVPPLPAPNAGVSAVPTIPGMASAAFPSSPQLPPGVTSVPGFLPNAPQPPVPGSPPFGAAPVGPGPAGFAPFGAPGNGPNTPVMGQAVPFVPPTVAPSGGPTLTAKAPPGVTYDMMRGQGWTDDMMRQQGYLA